MCARVLFTELVFRFSKLRNRQQTVEFGQTDSIFAATILSVGFFQHELHQGSLSAPVIDTLMNEDFVFPGVHNTAYTYLYTHILTQTLRKTSNDMFDMCGGKSSSADLSTRSQWRSCGSWKDFKGNRMNELQRRRKKKKREFVTNASQGGFIQKKRKETKRKKQS